MHVQHSLKSIRLHKMTLDTHIETSFFFGFPPVMYVPRFVGHALFKFVIMWMVLNDRVQFYPPFNWGNEYIHNRIGLQNPRSLIRCRSREGHRASWTLFLKISLTCSRHGQWRAKQGVIGSRYFEEFRSEDHVLLDSGKQSSDDRSTFGANSSRRFGIEVGTAHTPSRIHDWLKRDKEGY